jgi:hypothetical protein
MLTEILIILDDTLYSLERSIIDILLCILVFTLFLLIKNYLLDNFALL